MRRQHGLPFGGFKRSELGREGLSPSLETKSLILDGLPSGTEPTHPAPGTAARP